MNRLLGLLCIVLGVALGATGCDDGDNCGAGEACECSGGNDCFLQCSGSGCNESCHNQVHCGGVCDDHCAFECHDMNDCTTSCGEACNASCHNVVSCGAIVGPDSFYSCHDASRCGVTVQGPGTTVDCRNVTTCEVACDSSCDVECRNTDTCRVICNGDEHECRDGDSCGC